MGLTVGQIMAGVGGGGGGGGGGVGGVGGGAASSLRGGPGKAELLLGLAQMARTLSISQSPDDKIVFRVLWLIRRARFKAVEIAIAIVNPSINSASLPLAPRSTAHYKKSNKILLQYCFIS